MVLFFILLACISKTVIASPFGCAAYLGGKGNALFNMSLVGGWNDDPNDKNADEITPDKEIDNNGSVFQYYYLEKQHQHYKKVLLMCVYHDRRVIVNEIPKSLNICKRTYSPQSPIVAFICY